MTQGESERYHGLMKNFVNLRNYFWPWTLGLEIARFLDHSNHRRYSEALEDSSPADVHFGRAEEPLTRRNAIKKKTLEQRYQQKLHSASL